MTQKHGKKKKEKGKRKKELVFDITDRGKTRQKFVLISLRIFSKQKNAQDQSNNASTEEETQKGDSVFDITDHGKTVVGVGYVHSRLPDCAVADGDAFYKLRSAYLDRKSLSLPPSVKPPDPTSSNRTQSSQILRHQKDPRENRRPKPGSALFIFLSFFLVSSGMAKEGTEEKGAIGGWGSAFYTDSSKGWSGWNGVRAVALLYLELVI